MHPLADLPSANVFDKADHFGVADDRPNFVDGNPGNRTSPVPLHCRPDFLSTGVDLDPEVFFGSVTRRVRRARRTSAVSLPIFQRLTFSSRRTGRNREFRPLPRIWHACISSTMAREHGIRFLLFGPSKSSGADCQINRRILYSLVRRDDGSPGSCQQSIRASGLSL